MSAPPAFYETVRQKAARRWDQLEQDPERALHTIGFRCPSRNSSFKPCQIRGSLRPHLRLNSIYNYLRRLFQNTSLHVCEMQTANCHRVSHRRGYMGHNIIWTHGPEQECGTISNAGMKLGTVRQAELKREISNFWRNSSSSFQRCVFDPI